MCALESSKIQNKTKVAIWQKKAFWQEQYYLTNMVHDF